MIHKTKGFVCHHVPKTGGTSIGNWMSKNIGKDIYWVGSGGVRTLIRDAEGEMFLDWKDDKFEKWDQWWSQHGRGKNGFPPHMQVDQTKSVLRRNKRTKHLKTWHFAFLRNPYDWVTSLFWYRRNMRSGMDRVYKKAHSQKDVEKAFRIFLECIQERDGFPAGTDSLQCFWINSSLDFIGDFSQLEEDFKKIMSRFDITVDAFPKVNVQPQNKSVYLWKSDRVKDMAAEILAKDIELYEKTFNKRATYE